MWMTFYLLEEAAWHRFKRTGSFVFPLCSQFGQIWEQEVGCMYYKGMLHSWVLFSSTFPTSPPPHSSYAWFLTWLRPHKNAIHWISYPWMVWFGSQSVSSPCPREACSVPVPAVYLWAGLGPALLIIHETFDGPKKKSTRCWILIPTNDLGRKISNFSARF